MAEVASEIAGIRVLRCAADGTLIRNDKDVIALITAAWAQGAKMILVPVQRLHGDFFLLSTRIAGEIIQKFANYGMKLVVVGDVSAYLTQSSAFADFVKEANRGRQVWFVDNEEQLQAKLQGR